MDSERPKLRFGKPDLGFEKPQLRSGRPYSGSDRPDLKLKILFLYENILCNLSNERTIYSGIQICFLKRLSDNPINFECKVR